jgi:DNA-binding response OmpR family regulator
MQPKGDILVVDDDQPTVDFIAEALIEDGYTVRAALDAAHTREAIIVRQPDLVLLDLHLPDKMGDVLVCDLQDDGLAGVPVVIMTADAKAARELAIEKIAFCLLKPFDLDDLFECVARHIRQRGSDTDAAQQREHGQ